MARRKPHLLIVYKKDAYQQCVLEQHDAHLARLLVRRHPDVLEMRQAHTVHTEALEAIIKALRVLPVTFELAYRADLKGARRYDLVVSVGGDGTFLQAARYTHGAPMLSVNSDPQHSEAVFAAATRWTFPALCRQALDGQLPVSQLYRLALTLNGRKLPHRTVNDVLLAHPDPSTMSRYRLHVGSRIELQKSSGLWISTAAGSSSAVLAAGGKRLPWTAKRFQFHPRELYHGRLAHPRLTGSVLPASTSVRVTWLMQRGCVFLDGPHVKIPLQFADRLEVRLSVTDPLHVLGVPRARWSA